MHKQEQRAQHHMQCGHPRWGRTPERHRAEARMLVPLGVVSGPVSSEVGLPETCSVQGVPEAGCGWRQQLGQALGEQGLQSLP